MFDFITGEEFRQGLDSDYRELCEAMAGRCWKTVHVLAGSIVEAVLIDYLVANDYQVRTGKDPLKLDLAQAIAACVAEKVLSQRTADLGNVVREYRNLIHPGRIVRLAETIDENSATIAKALVAVVVSELATNKRLTYGYTAEQIVTKLEKDPSAASILPHLFKNTNKTERKRLLLSVLPNRYMAIMETMRDTDSEVLEALSSAFRQAFWSVDDDVKGLAIQRYVSFLKEESGPFITAYEDAFVTASDLSYAEPSELALIKQRLLARLAKDGGSAVLRIMKDNFVEFLIKSEVPAFIDPLVKLAVVSKKTQVRTLARTILDSYVFTTTSEQDTWIGNRLDHWIDQFKKAGNLEAAKLLGGFKAFAPLVDDDVEEVEVEDEEVSI